MMQMIALWSSFVQVNFNCLVLLSTLMDSYVKMANPDARNLSKIRMLVED